MDRLVVRISVRNLVEFILRFGNIDRRRSGRAEKEAMLKGSRIHRKIQGRMPSTYQAEASLKMKIEREDFVLLLEGRADGIDCQQGAYFVDEIKGVYRDLNMIFEPVELHLAQAKCYAYIYAKQKSLAQIGVRLTYCHIETEQLKYFYNAYNIEELETWFQRLIKEYEKWAKLQADWLLVRNQTIAKLSFPFSYRKGQKQLVAGVFRTIEQKKKLFIQASTGVGKTISTLYPAVQSIGCGMAEKIFYLTAKTITRTAAEDALSLLKEQGLRMKALTITAKEKLCVCEETNCNPDYCLRAKGHFDRVNDCIYEMLNAEDDISRDIIESYASRYQVCPFEMCLDAALWCDVIICDYNYAFDYNICLKRFFGDNVKGEYLFLIDEAHNLLERGRELYSASLCKEDFLHFKQITKYAGLFSDRLKKAFESCNRILLSWKKQCVSCLTVSGIELGNFVIALDQLVGLLEQYLEEDFQNRPLQEQQCRESLLEFYFQARNFLFIYGLNDEHYINYFEYSNDRFYVHLYCVNPSLNLQHFLEKGRSSVFFSATMLPIDYYMKLLSVSYQEDYSLYAESSFLPDMRQVLIGSDVSAKYTRRNETEFEKIANYLAQIVASKAGNYIVYFPSYRFMEEVYVIFHKRFPDVDSAIQQTEMTEREKEAFLDYFAEKQQLKDQRGFLAFCVLGGSFGEGIDLKEELLIGVIIVGTGLPLICNQRELLRRYFEELSGNGFDYAYRFAGFSKALQAAGRVIRTERDKGVIVLLDSRYMEWEYQRLFPREWENVLSCRLETTHDILKEFWQ